MTLSVVLPIGMISNAFTAACEPASHVLPLLPGDVSGGVLGMNDRGWAVGESMSVAGQQWFSRAVLWRDGGGPEELGLGGEVREDGSVVRTRARYVNEDGVIAVTRERVWPGDSFGRQRVILWHAGVATRLPAGNRRNSVEITSLNDRGIASGYIYPTDRQGPIRAVVWRDGELLRLPEPRDTQGSDAAAVNNFGLVVGSVRRDRDWDPWYWRIGGGNGPIAVPNDINGGLRLDDAGRIIIEDGIPRRSVLIDGPRGSWQRLPHRRVTAMSNQGDVVGLREGVNYVGWVGRLFSEEHPLPPPSEVTDWTWSFPTAVIRGTTNLAPQGGVSVGGIAHTAAGPTAPVIWTCVATS